jgi:hypothetical protein
MFTSGPLTVTSTGGEIFLVSNTDVDLKLGDNAGANVFSVQDSDNVDVLIVDSNGNLTLSGTVDTVDIAAHAANGDAHHAESHTVASHNDTTATGAELETLTDGSDAADIHIHDARYFRENEHLNATAGAADAGKPIKLDADGQVDDTMIDDSSFVTDSDFAAKGDVVTATGAGASAILSVGADTHVLTADSAQGTGLKWAAAAGGGDVTAAANMTDQTIVRGDGGAKGVEDTGWTIDDSDDQLAPGDAKIQFRDSAIYLQSPTDGNLLIVADTAVTINKLEPRYRNHRAPFEIESPAVGDIVKVYIAGHSGSGAKAPYAKIVRIAANVEGASASIDFNAKIRTVDAFHTGGTDVFAADETVTAYEEWSSFTADEVDATADGSADECVVIEIEAVNTAADWFNGWVELELQD